VDSINSIHTQAGALCGLRWEEKMKVLGHENPAHQQEAQRLAELPQHVDEIAPERLDFEKPHAAISAAGDELQFRGTEIAQIYKPQSCALRQPRSSARDLPT